MQNSACLTTFLSVMLSFLAVVFQSWLIYFLCMALFSLWLETCHLPWSWSWWLCRLGPCPGINVDRKTGRALNIWLRWGIKIPPPTLQTPLRLWGCSSQKQFWWKSCFCRYLFLHYPKRSSGCCFWWTSWWCCWRWSQICWWSWSASCSAHVRKDSAGKAGMRLSTIL